MGTAHYVGRVGGLAVALGIGAAVLTLGEAIAWAEPDASQTSAADAPDTPAGSAGRTPAGPRKPDLSALRLAPERIAERLSTAAESLRPGAAAGVIKPVVRVGAGRPAPGGPASATERTQQVVRRSLSLNTVTSAPTAAGGVLPANPVLDTLGAAAVLGTAAVPGSGTKSDLNPYAPTIGVTNGVVTGTNTGEDPSDAQSEQPSAANVSYHVISDPSGGGKVTVDKTTGDFSYLPYATGQNPDGSAQFADSEEFKVLVMQTSPLMAELEKIPVAGDFVEPVLVGIHQVPVVGDVLSPIIGYAVIVPVTVDDAALAADYVDPIAFTTMVTSFDGTRISVNYFPASGLKAGEQAPTILNGPSLATAGYTDPNQEITVFGLVPGLAPMRDAGYNVVTWDPRGEFASGGVLHLDSPDYEARDVSAIITWVAGQPGTQFDAGSETDPLIGMVGGSYGGGIQLTSAGIDDRIDVIAPGIAWNSLNSSLYPNGGFKTSFASLLLLSLVVADSRIAPTIYTGIATGAVLGVLTPHQQQFLDDVSPSQVVGNIDIPTMFLQGTADDLFPLQQSIDNAEQLPAGTPVTMIWYCGGHGQCLDPVDQDAQSAFLTTMTLDWMDLYLKGVDPDEIPNFQWVDQKGTLYASTYLPTEGSQLYDDSVPVTASATGGVLAIVPVVGGSGPQTEAKFPVSLALGSRAKNAIDIPIANNTPQETAYVVGAPTVTMTYSGVGTSRVVYAQLVDNETGRVVGNVVTAIPVTLDGKEHTVTVPMEAVAYTMEPGDSLTLQIVGSATAYEDFTSYGAIDVKQVDVSLPTANPDYVDYEGSFATDEPGTGGGGLLGV